MQNYQNLIDELFSLDIERRQYFVKDGQILYDIWTAAYAAAPPELCPGYLADFMNLEKYDQHRKNDRYADKLTSLQRRALTDFLLLDPLQTTRFLADAKRKREQLTQLLNNAIEYQKAWEYNTLDQLPDSFLELRLLDAFTTPNRPEASPHLRFAHHLTEAIMYKRGALAGLIKEIEHTIQPIQLTAELTDLKVSKQVVASTPGFETYLLEHCRERLMPYLALIYTDRKPEDYGFMLYALVDCEYIAAGSLTVNQTALHKALGVSFGRVGSRQNLNVAINRLDTKTRTAEDKRQIEIHKQRIYGCINEQNDD